MNPTRLMSLRAVVITVVTLTAAACSIAIDWPKNNGDSVCPPVQVVVNWQQGSMNNFTATLDGVDVTSQFFVSYSAGRASAQLTATPGLHVLMARGDFKWWFVTFPGTAGKMFAVPGLTLAASPTSLTLPKNSGATSTIVASACQGVVNVTLAPLPSGVTATPASFTINMPGPSNPGISGSTSSSRTTTIQASASAPTGRYPVNVNGTLGIQSASTTFTIDMGTPTIGAVTPILQTRGGPVTISGTGFDPACANNIVSLGGINVTPSICSPAGTSLSISIPPQANYGATQVKVTVGGLASNVVSLTVARLPGDFVSINVVSQMSNSMCSNADGSPGNVEVQIAGGSNLYDATFVRAGVAIAPAIRFAQNNLPRWSNGGGAGFSVCTAGLVLDAAPALQMLNLENAVRAPGYTFSLLTTSGGFVNPQFSRSQDGSVILVLTAGSSSNFTAAFIDVDKTHFGHVISTIPSCGLMSLPRATINTSNKIELTCGGPLPSTIAIP